MYLCGKRRPLGYLFRGKHRLLKEVTPKDRNNLINDYAREEQNMFYLRHPYLTFDQSKGHAQDLKKKEQWIDNFRKTHTKYRDHFTMEMQYSHLNVKDAWE